MTDAQRVAYYAEGELLLMNKWNYRENISKAIAKGIKYIVVEEKNIGKNYPDLMELAKKDFILQDIPLLTPKGQEKYLVFKLRY